MQKILYVISKMIHQYAFGAVAHLMDNGKYARPFPSLNIKKQAQAYNLYIWVSILMGESQSNFLFLGSGDMVNHSIIRTYYLSNQKNSYKPLLYHSVSHEKSLLSYILLCRLLLYS